MSLTEVTARRAPAFHLDQLAPLQARVGWGRLGTQGDLGYEGKSVSVGGVHYDHALSTHPPARLLYYLGGASSAFRCQVALNDDAPRGSSYADFAVIADGREVAHARDVWARQPPRTIEVGVEGAQLLELVVSTEVHPYSHAVWLDPRVDGATSAGEGALIDCLGTSEIALPPPLPVVGRCIATVASPGFEAMLDDMLGSLVANGGCPDALILVFLIGTSPACESVIGKYRAIPIHCTPVRAITPGSKALLYSVARIVEAERYLCLDADTLVLGDLGPLFAAADVCPSGSILVAREGNSHGYRDLSHVLRDLYGGEDEDFARILGEARAEASYALVVNDGVFAGARPALLALDGCIRSMPGQSSWLASRPELTWLRNQFIFNLALAHLDSGVELDETNNLQLHTSDVEVASVDTRPDVRWQGRHVRILHLNGSGRNKHRTLRGLYASVADPLVGAGDGDGYAEFLDVLRGWLGRRGIGGLDQSFYGAPDPARVRVRDPSTLPVLALVHYLFRANGCVRVLETGTMCGVSAACIASAVAHRPGGRVVSFDPFEYSGRQELWDSLPGRMRNAIEPRCTDSIAGLTAALDAGEQYDGALLDSLHTEGHLWGEFELAARLVRPGGLILLHDWRWSDPVQRVLARIGNSGYGIVRLLGPGGVDEDSGLGMALVENQPR